MCELSLEVIHEIEHAWLLIVQKIPVLF